MKVQVDGRVVEFVRAEGRDVTYHELNDQGQPCRSHSFRSDVWQGNDSFVTNGHHYKTGNLVGTPCVWDECKYCPRPEKTTKSRKLPITEDDLYVGPRPDDFHW